MFILFLFSSIINPLYAQDFWESIAFPDTAFIRCMTVDSSGNILIGTGENNAKGGLYRSLEGYDEWELIYNAEYKSVKSVAVRIDSIYFSHSGNNAFNVSCDGGDSWVSKELPEYSNGNVSSINCQYPGVIYVGTGSNPYANPLLLRSYDNGDSWDSLYSIENGTTSAIRDILLTKEGYIYFCVDGYYPGAGGVYRSIDNGETWEFIGLIDHLMECLDINSNGDIIAGAWGGANWGDAGVYILHKDENDWAQVTGGNVQSCIYTKDDHIYTTQNINGVIMRSLDNGVSFENVNSGLSDEDKPFLLAEDPDGFLITATRNLIYRTSQSVASGVPQNNTNRFNNCELEVYPNPVNESSTFGYTLQKEGYVEFRIFATDGTPIQTINEGIQNTGSHEYTYHSSSLDAGMYYCSLVVDKVILETRKMIVIKD